MSGASASRLHRVAPLAVADPRSGAPPPHADAQWPVDRLDATSAGNPAWARTRDAFHAARDEPTVRAALVEALRGLPWVLSKRERIPLAIEDGLARLERG